MTTAELARFRLTPPAFNHATTTGTLYPPAEAASAGFLDRVVDHASLLTATREEARRLARIDMTAHANTKQRVRHHALAAMREGHEKEFGHR